MDIEAFVAQCMAAVAAVPAHVVAFEDAQRAFGDAFNAGDKAAAGEAIAAMQRAVAQGGGSADTLIACMAYHAGM